MASCISKGTRSKGSCFPFPFTLGAFALETTREFSGARTNDVSAIKEESFWSTNNLFKLPYFIKCKKNAHFVNNLHGKYALWDQYCRLLRLADVDDGVQTRSYLWSGAKTSLKLSIIGFGLRLLWCIPLLIGQSFSCDRPHAFSGYMGPSLRGIEDVTCVIDTRCDHRHLVTLINNAEQFSRPANAVNTKPRSVAQFLVLTTSEVHPYFHSFL